MAQTERVRATGQSKADAERIAAGLTGCGQPARVEKRPNGKYTVWAYPAPSQPMFTRPTDSLSKRSSTAKAANESEAQVKKSKPGDWRKK